MSGVVVEKISIRVWNWHCIRERPVDEWLGSWETGVRGWRIVSARAGLAVLMMTARVTKSNSPRVGHLGSSLYPGSGTVHSSAPVFSILSGFFMSSNDPPFEL